jgi:hypothetical protein
MSHSDQIQTIAESQEPILSAYLNTQNRNASQHPRVPLHLAWFRKMAASLSQTLPPQDSARFQHEVARVEHFLEGRHPEEKALAIFAGQETWNALPLQIGVENEIRWGKPAVGQLFRLQREHAPYGIVVVDHQAARFFQYFLGEFIELGEKRFEIDQSQWKKKDIGHVNSEKVRMSRGTNQDLFEHRLKAQYDHLCRDTTDQAMAYSKQHDFAAIFLVGLDQLVGPIQQKFPPSFRGRLVSVPEDYGKLSPSKILRRLEPLMADYEQKQQLLDVQQLLATEKGTVTDVDETLARVQDGSIRTLVLAADHDFNLRKCEKCGMVNRSSDLACTSCGGKRRNIALLDVLPSLAAEHGTKVQFVTGKAARILTKAGGIAGWLRRPVSSAVG